MSELAALSAFLLHRVSFTFETGAVGTVAVIAFQVRVDLPVAVPTVSGPAGLAFAVRNSNAADSAAGKLPNGRPLFVRLYCRRVLAHPGSQQSSPTTPPLTAPPAVLLVACDGGGAVALGVSMWIKPCLPFGPTVTFKFVFFHLVLTLALAGVTIKSCDAAVPAINTGRSKIIKNRFVRFILSLLVVFP